MISRYYPYILCYVCPFSNADSPDSLEIGTRHLEIIDIIHMKRYIVGIDNFLKPCHRPPCPGVCPKQFLV